MFGKLTGTFGSKDETRGNILTSRENYRSYTDILRQKKEEYQQLKRNNDKERKQMLREQKAAEKMKFGSMKSKQNFKPTTLHSKPFTKLNSLAIGDPFVEAYEKARLCQPERAYNKTVAGKWTLQKTCDGELFQRTVR